MTRAACTIVSLNYLPYARVLCASFLRHHPDSKFYVLLVDRLPQEVDLSSEEFELVLVEELGIRDFQSISFKYDILELNTNVKPTFLKSLLAQDIDQLVYLDPDIVVYQPLDSVFGAMAEHAIVLTPHSLSPDPDDIQSEVILLLGGVFNLGFVALKKSEEAERFLLWWESRCLGFAFNEPHKGMFVDQKWINLAPCFFDPVKILKDPACNMAYWNLHERTLTRNGDAWIVNGANRLAFFHFSGIRVDGGEEISKHNGRFSLTNRPDLRLLFEDYRAQLLQRGIREFKTYKYAFSFFDNGQYINRLVRSLYAANIEKFDGEDPFRSSSRFYSWARSARLLSARDTASSYNTGNYSKGDPRVRIIHFVLRMMLRVLGADRYTVLFKYLSHISILRNQSDVFAV